MVLFCPCTFKYSHILLISLIKPHFENLLTGLRDVFMIIFPMLETRCVCSVLTASPGEMSAHAHQHSDSEALVNKSERRMV